HGWGTGRSRDPRVGDAWVVLRAIGFASREHPGRGGKPPTSRTGGRNRRTDGQPTDRARPCFPASASCGTESSYQGSLRPQGGYRMIGARGHVLAVASSLLLTAIPAVSRAADHST